MTDSGQIVEHHGVRVRIKTTSGLVEWKPPRRETWVVGDIVLFKNGKPHTIAPRKTKLDRIGANGKIQTLAANIDTLLVVTACGELYKPGLVDRFCVAANHAGIKPAVILNKTDLDPEQKFEAEAKEYAAIGYPFFAVSALTGEGIDKLTEFIKDRVTALVGHSGVGKTSILNALVPGEEQATGKVHEKTAQGRHTTSSATLVSVPSGGFLIDSPGIRHFAPSGLTAADVALFFPGITPHLGGCKFGDCLHLSEPKCSVIEAVEDNAISKKRYESYCRLIESVKETEPRAWEKKKQ